MKARHRLVQLVALGVVVSMPVLGMAGIASAVPNPPNPNRGTPAWCLAHPHKAKHVPACATTTGVPTLTIAPNPLVETGQSEVHAVVEFEDLTAADQKVDINSSQLSAACGGTITFSDLQGVTATTPPNSKITPATTTNFVSLGIDDEGNATAVVSGTDCAPGTDIFDATLPGAPYATALATLKVNPPVMTKAGVTAAPATEVETGDTKASGDSDVYAVFYVEGDPVWAEQEAEISDPQLESSCLGGWIWEPGNQTLAGGATSGNVSGNPHNTGSGLQTTIGHEPFTTIDDDGNSVFVFMGISCAPSSTLVPPGSTAIAEVAFNLVGSHPTYTGTFVVEEPQPT